MSKFLKSFHFAWQGISYTFRTQLNFRVEVLAAVLACGLSYYLELNTQEWLWVIAAIVLVLLTELLNTGIETLVDLVSPEYNPRAGIVKDISAAVVLMAAIFALMVALFIFLPKICYAA